MKSLDVKRILGPGIIDTETLHFVFACGCCAVEPSWTKNFGLKSWYRNSVFSPLPAGAGCMSVVNIEFLWLIYIYI